MKKTKKCYFASLFSLVEKLFRVYNENKKMKETDSYGKGVGTRL